MAGELNSLLSIITPRLDRMESKLEAMNGWMHEIKGALKVTSIALGVVIALLIKALGG